MSIQIKRGLKVNLPTEAKIAEMLYTTDERKLYIGNGTGQPLTDVVGAGSHTQNTDTGTTQTSFMIDSTNANAIVLKNSAGEVQLRNKADSDYADLRVKNLTVEGNSTIIKSEVVEIADNILTMNSNFIVGSPTEDAGIVIKRGDESDAKLVWNETTDKWQIGTVADLKNIILEGDSRIHSSDLLGTKTLIETNIATGKFMYYNGTNIDYTDVIDGGTF